MAKTCVCKRNGCILCEGGYSAGLPPIRYAGGGGLIVPVSFPARAMLFPGPWLDEANGAWDAPRKNGSKVFSR